MCWSIQQNSKLSVTKQDRSQNERISKGASSVYIQPRYGGNQRERWLCISHS
jgi:hypothetical protein